MPRRDASLERRKQALVRGGPRSAWWDGFRPCTGAMAFLREKPNIDSRDVELSQKVRGQRPLSV